MSKDVKELYEERLGRYQAAIALEATDRIPIASGSNYFSEIYSGNNNQETIYDSEKWLQAEMKFVQDFPAVDVLRSNRVWAPLYDAIGLKTYKLPGRDLPADSQFQFVEAERMKVDEYDLLINNPNAFMMERFLPRVLGECTEYGSPRSNMAFLKGGMAFVMMQQVMRNRSAVLQNVAGIPQPTTGAFLAPFDVLGDAFRGLTGVLTDMYRQPDKLLEACDVLVNEMVNFALATADPLKRYPIFVPTHKACFMSPKQFETFYWPSFKKTLEILIEAGYTVRAYLEGDWTPHWHHMLELPKGKVLCDIDNQADVIKAKNDIGHHQCIAGGIPDSLFILGTPQDIRARVKLLSEKVGGRGFIINGGCNIPYTTKPENYQAMIDAVLEFGIYDHNIKHVPKTVQPGKVDPKSLYRQRKITPWEVKSNELGGVQGDEELIRSWWDTFENMGHTWMWQWVM